MWYVLQLQCNYCSVYRYITLHYSHFILNNSIRYSRYMCTTYNGGGRIEWIYGIRIIVCMHFMCIVLETHQVHVLQFFHVVKWARFLLILCRSHQILLLLLLFYLISVLLIRLTLTVFSLMTVYEL